MRLQAATVVALAGAVSASPVDCERNTGTALGTDSASAIKYQTNPGRANAIKEAFNFSWKGYMKHAFPHDSLQPVDNTWRDDRNGWGASAFDALSTAIIMENTDAVNTILDHIAKVNFDYSATDVSFFETSIRYLAAMVSGYDLLSGPFSHLINGNMTRIQPVLSQAKHLGDKLKAAYQTPSGIPINGLEFHKDGSIVRHNDPKAGIAGCTLPLEWQRLSDLTGDPQYGNFNKKAVSHFLNPEPKSNEPYPGLIGQNFDPKTGKSVDANGGWTAGSDSFYEYLIKAYLYNKKDYGQYKDRWILAADSSIKYLASHPSSRPDLTFLGSWHNKTINYSTQHFACFDGGNFILGGLTLNRKDLVDFGLRLTESCHAVYASTVTHIGPDSWSWQDSKNKNTNPPKDQQDRFKKSGYWINDASFRLRPEVIESYYYAWRATGDTKYQEWAWDAFVHINSTCRVGSGFAELNNINDRSKGYTNHQESFFFAELLKYSYIMHINADAPWQVKTDQTNDWVFNTEAHPIRLAHNGRG